MKKTIRAGGSLEDAAARFLATWHAAALTPRRLELIRHLRATPAPSIRAAARALGRDYKRVHDDITALAQLGILEQRDGFWLCAFDEIETRISLKPAA